MRILFICPTVEPGRSGVGDYTVGLAASAASAGAETHVLAFAESSIESPSSGVVNFGAESAATTRVPRSCLSKQLRHAITTALTEIRPDWISLQWVPYAFHPKGLAAWGPFPWDTLTGGAKMHWMIHETWIGGFAGAPWKMRLTGSLQRWMMRRLFFRVQVRLAHTSNTTYVRQLNHAGMAAVQLPLFGALPTVTPETAWCGWEKLLGAEQGGPIITDRGKVRIFCFFGTIHQGFPSGEVFRTIRESVAREDRRAVILSLGHAGDGGSQFDEWARRWEDGMIFRRLGSLGDAATASVLAHSDFGLSTTPLNVIGKSSAAATMSELGLPVLTGSMGAAVDGWLPGLRDAAPRFWLAEDYLANRLHESVPRPRMESRRPEIARRFLSDLASAS